MPCFECLPGHARATLAIVLALVAGAARADDLGVIGPVTAIDEPSLLEVILTRLRAAAASGEIDALEKDMQAKARREIEQPVAVRGLLYTTQPRRFYYDPSIVVPYPLSDASGAVIVAPGTHLNPLDTVSLSQPLLFLDARDAIQIARAKVLLQEQHGRLKLILTGGSYLALMRQLQQPVYFDQGGLLTARLGIHQLPALVTQDGKQLRIDEIR